MREHGSNSVAKSEKVELTIKRIFNAPCTLVWKAWTDPALVKRWWGPKDYTTPTFKIDLRVGGKYLYCMRSSEGQEFWGTGIYKEIVPCEKIVCTDNFADEDGNTVQASALGMPGEWPDSLLVTVTFEDIDGKTKMTLKHLGLPAGEMSDLTEAGWNESFDKLVENLK